jgi:hypothetical protein
MKDLHSCIPYPPPIIVIATKIDLRNNSGNEQRKLLTSDELHHFAQTINAVDYFECSAIENVRIITLATQYSNGQCEVKIRF